MNAPDPILAVIKDERLEKYVSIFIEEISPCLSIGLQRFMKQKLTTHVSISSKQKIIHWEMF